MTDKPKPTIGLVVPDAVPRDPDSVADKLAIVDVRRPGNTEGPYACRWGGCNGSGHTTCDRCGSPVAKPRPVPEIVGRATRAVSGLLKVATDEPGCFDPSVYVKNLGGDLVEVTVPLSGLLVDRLAAFVEQMQPPTDEEIAEATARIEEESDAQKAVIDAAIDLVIAGLWKGERGSDDAAAALERAVNTLLDIRASKRSKGDA